ncbi:MAG TPA: hypothetical protein VFZ61_13560 [Polyangiales bacterium]
MAGLAGLGLAAGLWWFLANPPQERQAELCGALQQHRLTVVYTSGVGLRCTGARTFDPTPELRAVLAGKDAPKLRAALLREKGSAIAVATHLGAGPQAATTLAEQLSRYAQPEGLRGIALSPRLAVYAPRRESELSLRERDALAYVARALLRGAREPSLNSFPPSLRRVERVEVMVMLREHGEPRLWRSARGTSVARALLTATRVARDRWHERETAMGGPLARRLLDLDVEVSLLSEEGTLLGDEPALLDRATLPEHGIGFEFGASWHYVLPEDMQRRGRGSAHRALLALLSEQGLPATVTRQSDFRAYRFVTLMLGVSKAPLGEGSSPG